MSCSGSLKKGRFGYQWQAALALVGPIYDTSVKSTIFTGMSSDLVLRYNFFTDFKIFQSENLRWKNIVASERGDTRKSTRFRQHPDKG